MIIENKIKKRGALFQSCGHDRQIRHPLTIKEAFLPL
jgi:hypothetical protein